MTSNKDHFDEFEPHTRLKHAILEAYLQAWAFKLLESGRYGDRVWFLDGFAGPGADKAGNPGSPTIACRVAAQVRTRFDGRADSRRRRLGVVCIEKKQEYFDRLTEHLEPFRPQDPEHLVLLLGEFASRCADALARTSELLSRSV